MFKGINEKDGELYDTREEAIYRANMLTAWANKPLHVYAQREWVPDWLLWMRDFFRDTPLEFLFYERLK
jgi:hypothetical protein